jgi:hypothetical protein
MLKMATVNDLIAKLKIKTFETRRDPESRDASRGRVYLHPAGETILENFTSGRRTRPYTTFRKELMPEVLVRLGLPADTKISWSRKAGCSCGCSPGFIVDAWQVKHTNTFVTYVAEEN